MKKMTRVMMLCLAICMFSCVLLTSTASAAPLTAPDGTTDFFNADAEEAARNPYLRWSAGWNQTGPGCRAIAYEK